MERPREQAIAEQLQRGKVFLACALEAKALVDSAISDNPQDLEWKDRKTLVDQKIEKGRDYLFGVLKKILAEEPDHKVEVVSFSGLVK